MYSTCLFCHASLGRNEAIEALPVGRRIAFDAARGRLWVVCRRCERWNLSPLEERWEAIEAAERAFRATRLRVSTDNVGLARLRDGLELVRIGAPLRPELAAWRYGDQFGRRRNRALLLGAGTALVATAVLVAGPLTGVIGAGLFGPLLNTASLVRGAARRRRTVVLETAPGEAPLRVGRLDVKTLQLRTDASGRHPSLQVGGVRSAPARWRPGGAERAATHVFHGDDALRAAARVLPLLNHAGASRRVVSDAVDLLEIARTPAECFALVAAADRRRAAERFWQPADPGTLYTMPAAARLALEMAAHEESERRALNGELADLERAWRAAEEIAAIADDLLMPPSVGQQLDRLKGRR